MAFIEQVTIILITTLVAGYLSNRIGIPAVLGQLIAGIIVGPAILKLIAPTNFLHDMAEIGVILLMFVAGCESNLDLLKKYFKPSMLAAVCGIILPIIFVWPLALLFGMSTMHALFLGVVFAATSVSISIVVLKELGYINNREASTILGAAVVDDILAVIVLSLMMAFVGQEKFDAVKLLSQLALQAVFFVGIFVVIKWITPIIFKVTQQLNVQYSTVITSLIIAFGLAYLAELVGLSDVVGAFFAGIAISQTPYQQKVGRAVEDLGQSLFMPIFFVNIGLSMSFNHFLSQVGFIIALVAVAFITKVIGCGGAVRLLGYDFDSALVVGTGMVPRGEMGLIVAQIGLTNHLMSPTHYSAIIMTIILTTLIAPIFLKMAINRQHQHQRNIAN